MERVKISLGRPKIFNLSELGTTYKAQVIVMTIFGYGLNLMFCFVVAAVVVVFYFLEKIKQFWNDYLLSYNYQHKHLAERMVITCLTQHFTHSSTLISAEKTPSSFPLYIFFFRAENGSVYNKKPIEIW